MSAVCDTLPECIVQTCTWDMPQIASNYMETYCKWFTDE